MKNVFKSKIAALLASLMVISLVVPAMAFARFDSIDWDKRKSTPVAGSIYINDTVYNNEAFKGFLNDNGSIWVKVYSGNTEITSLDAVYATYRAAGGTNPNGYYYDFEDLDLSSLRNNQFPLTLKYFDGEDWVSSERLSLRSSGGGGGIFFPPTDGSGISVGADGRVNAAQLAAALANGGSVTIELSGEFVILPAYALVGGNSVTIKTADASYTLPISALKLEALAESLEVTLNELEIRVDIKKLAGEAADAVNAITSEYGKSLAPAIEFKVTALAGEKQQEINNFGQYVSRTINLTEDASRATAVRVNTEEGTVSFVPTSLKSEDDVTVAGLLSTTNSIYTVLSVQAQSFSDLAASHWANSYVASLSSNLIVEGTGAGKFEPRRAITRAEFAAMIVRSLGLEVSGSASQFSDVSSSAWYAGVVATAAEAGIVQGDPNGTFRPNANISRQELAAMVVRAMKFAGKEVAVTDAEVSAALAPYADAASVTWAKAEVAAAIKAGIVEGQSATQIAGGAQSNRAEAATMVSRFLTNVDFIVN